MRYTDGTELRQWDATHPGAVSGEVPLRCIEWPRVAHLVFESQYAGQHVFDVLGVPEGCQLRLRLRTMRANGVSLVAMLVCTERVGASDPPGPDDVLSVLYWLPDGSTHYCDDFRCAAVSEYQHHVLWGRPRAPLTPNHHRVALGPDAVMTTTTS